MTVSLVQRAGEAAEVRRDAHWRHVLDDLKFWTDWLTTNGVSLSTGALMEEYGWPNTGTDLANWQALGEGFLRYLDSVGMPRCSWGAGRFWQTYILGCWVNLAGGADIDTTQANARIYERHLGDARSGACVSGGEKRSGGSSGDPIAGGVYSNLNPGVYNTDYAYPTVGDFQYLKTRGIQMARVMIKHERLQRALSTALDITEIARLRQCLDDARTAGVKVVFCPWNMSRYRNGLDVNTSEIQYWSLLSSRAVDSFGGVMGVYHTTDFADFWQRMAHALKDHPALHGYSLMNEPGTPDEFGGTTGSNLVTVGSFDSNVSGWTGIGAALSWDSTNQRTGGGCAKIVTDSSGGLAQIGQQVSFPVTAGQQYQAAAFVKAGTTAGDMWTLQIDWTTAGGAYIQSDQASNYPLGVVGSYVQVKGGVVAPVGAGHAQVKVHTVNHPAAGSVNYIDDVSMYVGTVNLGGPIVEQFTQAAVTAIRTEDTAHEIWVPGFNNGPLHWHDYHKNGSWITDTASNFRYCAHYYFDALTHNGGAYTSTYAAEVAASAAAGY